MISENRRDLIRDSLRNLWRKIRIVDEDEEKMKNDEEEFMDLWLVLWRKMGEIQNKNHEERKLDKACEMERNFQKAVDMAEGFSPAQIGRGFQISRKMAFFFNQRK